MSILSVNAGSSSLKFALYPLHAKGLGRTEMNGCIEGLEPAGQPRISFACAGQSKLTQEVAVAANQEAFEAALSALKNLLATRFAHSRVQAIAHRVVHGGALFSRSVRVTADVLTQLASLNPLAPLHQPHNLAGIRAFTESFPEAVQVACFDTAFHSTLSPLETTFAIDQQLTAQGVRRYGFHGLSYQYVSQVLQREVPRSAGRVVMAHLGNGASACAMTQHISRATSMGFSALDGLMMGTRCGALDPGVLLYLLSQGWSHDRLQDLLYRQSGLLGVSGESADMRVLRACGTAAARFAIDLFTHRVSREIGALCTSIGGLDVLVFTGGIGEHDATLRQQVGDAMGFLGLRMDRVRNAHAKGDGIAAVHAADSAIEVWIVPTDEELVAAQEARALLS